MWPLRSAPDRCTPGRALAARNPRETMSTAEIVRIGTSGGMEVQYGGRGAPRMPFNCLARRG